MAAPISHVLSSVETDFATLTAAPEDYLTVQKSNATKLRKNLKCLYDAYKSNAPPDTGPALHQLIVKDFDEEQVWQQLELQNDNIVNKLLSDVAHLAASKQKPVFSSKDTYTASRVKQHIQKKNKNAPFDSGIGEDDVDNDQDLHEDEDVEEGHREGDEEISDDSLGENEDEAVEGIDENDKFFDFTGDSDDDLNFDFGPLGQKSDLNDDLFDNKNSEGEEENSNHKEKAKKHKKSVTFKDDIKHSNKEGKNSKDSPYKEKLRSSQKGNSLEKELSELEAFLDQEDKKEEKRIRREQEGTADASDEEEDDNIDLFDDEDSTEEDLFYDDFFDQPEDTDEEGDEEEENTDDDDDDDDDDDEDAIHSRLGVEEEEEEEDDEEEDAYQKVSSDDPSKGHGEVKGPKRAKRDLLAESDSEGEDVGEVLGGRKEQKSSFEIRQEKLKKKITDMEKEIVAEKPWQLAGEVSATKRPENSLLQENLQFEYTTRLAPEITEETTKTLEDLIKRRVRDKAWDDVERKVKPKDNPFEYKKRLTLDQEQSKLSLGEIYEQEYLKQQQADEEEKEDPDHESVKKMMQSLFLKLDSLSNFHYTPKQAMAEVKIVSNQPSINMEEVAPVAVADSELLAPEEIQDKSITEVKGDTEKTKTDRQRERKKKKAKKREKQKDKEKRQKLVEKLNPGLGNKYSKERALKKLEKDSKANNSGVTLIKSGDKEKGNRTSSKTFFTQLQEEVTTKINSTKANKRRNAESLKPNVKKFKL